jgi:ketosteroid isomerase-like protein
MGRFTIKGNVQGQDISGTYKLIDVFIKHQGQWRVVAEQSTRVTQRA